jgi:hypothetical protein
VPCRVALAIRARVALAIEGRVAHTAWVPDDPILYDRRLAHGPAVRVRRTSEPGVVPVTAVLEVDRRADTGRESLGGFPPPLMIVEAPSDREVLALLQPHATDDRLVAGLMRDKGLR